MAESLWTAAEIAAATGGVLNGAPFEVSGVSIDTRSIESGDLFVALAGVRDAHDFVPGALASGAAGSLTTRAVEGSCVVVGDTLKALELLGEAARDRAPAKRGAVTGSVGKTSVTRAVEAGLRLAGRGHASVKSYNNHIGVPLTLARMPRDTERAVFEVGMNHADEITPLSRMVRPHAVAITTVGPVHTENFPDGEEGVARAKAEIFAGLEPGGIAVLNADNKWFDLLKAEAEAVGATVWSFGSDTDCTACLTGFDSHGDGATVHAGIRGEAISFPILQAGHHWGLNSLCVLLMLEALDVPRATALEALAKFAPIEGRGAEKVIAIEGGDFTLVDESYNANPISMAAGIKNLGARKVAGRRIVALTDMLELGPQAAEHHAALASLAEDAGIDLVFCAGPLMKSLWEALPPTRRGGYAETAAELTPLVMSAVRGGDVIMVKGSNGSKAGTVAAALASLGSGSGAGGDH